MGPFAHLGLTSGAAVLGNSAWHYLRKPSSGNQDAFAVEKRGFWQFIDLRSTLAVLLGSILPDLIDKPVGHLFLEKIFSNGRIFGHTLVFLIILAIVGIVLYWVAKQNWLLLVSFGVLMHLVLDGMWLDPKTLLWPIFGFEFPRSQDIDFMSWISEIIRSLFNDPLGILSEIVGLLIFFWLIITALIHDKRKTVAV